ncbi:porin [Alphaproteobacteria bacterium]|nr:porin [Alphaproteobacteria bacterium]
MRKYLLSTSALAGAALMSSVAVADVNISGYMEWEMISGDTDFASTDGTSMAINNEVNIDFTNKTDSGLTITFNTDLDTDSGGVDDNSMSISGGFGKIVVGETDGVEDVMAISADGLVAEEHNMATGTTLTVDADNDIMLATGSQLDGNANGISYYLPAMGGLTAGITYKDSGAATSTDTTAFGATYAMETAGAAITLAYTSATTEAATQDSDATTLGVEIVMNGITFVANQATVETTTDDETGNSFGASYTLPSGITLAATTMKSEDDGATDLGEEYTVNHYELTYPVASGLSAVINVSDYDYKTGAGNTEKTADSGTISSLMLKASF